MNTYIYTHIHMYVYLSIYAYISCWTLRLLFKNYIKLLDSISLGSNRGQNAHHCCVHFNMGNYVKMRKFTKNKQRVAPKTIKSVQGAGWLQKDTKDQAQCQCKRFTGRAWESKKKQLWPNSREAVRKKTVSFQKLKTHPNEKKTQTKKCHKHWQTYY